MGDLPAAVPMYERSETYKFEVPRYKYKYKDKYKFEVPRMLFDDMVMLEAYVRKTEDQAVKRWWAQYMESTGEMESALHFYTLAKDYLSLVRYNHQTCPLSGTITKPFPRQIQSPNLSLVRYNPQTSPGSGTVTKPLSCQVQSISVCKTSVAEL